MPDKKESMRKLEKEVRACQKCPLYKISTQGVPGEGSPSAEIMFIGEGPGQKEDELGRPFVGAAGKLLDELLAHVELKREDVYIANVIKYRPPGNRDPLPDELEACWPFLEKQIEIIEPLVIATLGRHSLDRFLPGKSIRNVHGRALRAGGQVYFPLYHPAAALYSGNLRPALFDDFEKLPKVVEKVKSGDFESEDDSSKKQEEKEEAKQNQSSLF